eukprot:366387-Chlamydomonas_euryale.AAC.25
MCLVHVPLTGSVSSFIQLAKRLRLGRLPRVHQPQQDQQPVLHSSPSGFFGTFQGRILTTSRIDSVCFGIEQVSVSVPAQRHGREEAAESVSVAPKSVNADARLSGDRRRHEATLRGAACA